MDRKQSVERGYSTWDRAPGNLSHAIRNFCDDDGDDGKVDDGSVVCAPNGILAEQCHAQPVARRSLQLQIAHLQRIDKRQKEAGDEIEEILVENEHVFLVLLGGEHRVQNECVGCRSDKSSDYYGALEVERPCLAISGCSSRHHILRRRLGNRQVVRRG